MESEFAPWYTVDNIDEIPSPSLLVFADRVRENLRRMLNYAGGPQRLRPHVKTHKMPALVRMKLEAGIDKFKCSTIAEAEMVARSDGRDILLAFPQVGPNAARFAALAAAFPFVRFSTVADDAGLLRQLSAAAHGAGARIEVLLDIDNGMHRSGIEPGPAAVELYRLINQLPAIAPGGLHVYDGHLRDPDLEARTRRVQAAFVPVDALRDQLLAAGLPVPRIVAGGSGSFAVHAKRPDIECSPGTGVFWDLNYRARFPELDFLYAALLLGRVVSKPGNGRLCLDLGYKAVSPDNPHPRLALLDMRNVEVVNHSEEHLAIETSDAQRFSVGDPVLAVPYHVCPTVNLYREAVVIEGGHAAGRWAVLARSATQLLAAAAMLSLCIQSQQSIIYPSGELSGPMNEPARHATGLARLDAMLGGGLLPGTLTVVVGATGIGKTQLGIHYADAGVRQEGRRGILFDMSSRGDAQSHGQYARRIGSWQLAAADPAQPPDPATLFNGRGCGVDYLHVFDYSGRRVTRGDLDFDTWQGWQAELARKLAVTIAFFYGNFIAGSRRAVIDGVEPIDKPSESIQFELFEYIYHQILRKESDWVARDLLREHFRQYQEQVAAHRYDSTQVSCLLLYTSAETMLDQLIDRPLDQGDVLSNANTILYMGKVREGRRLGRAVYVAKHRGSRCSDEIVPYTINDGGLLLES